MHWACHNGHVGVAETLLKAGASVNIRDDKGQTPLMYTSSSGYVGVVETLLKAGVSIDTRDDKGQTPLICASSSGHVGVVESLLEAGAAFDSKTEGGKTALMFSAYWGHKPIIKLLLAAGADVRVRDKYGGRVLHQVLSKHSEDCAKQHVCAFCAGSETRQDMVKLLCEKGADPSAKNRDEEDPLSLVYEEGVFSRSEQKVLAKVLQSFGAR